MSAPAQIKYPERAVGPESPDGAVLARARNGSGWRFFAPRGLGFAMRPAWALALLATLVCSLTVAFGPISSVRLRPDRRDWLLDGQPHETPLSVAPTFKQSCELPLALEAQVPPPKKQGITLPDVLHVLQAHGLDARFPGADFSTGAELLQLLTDQAAGRACFGEPAFVRTRFGIRFLMGGKGAAGRHFEAHRDQCLAALAVLGLPLSTPLRLESEGDGTLADVLADSLANFDVRQREPAWTAIAYAHYLPPARSWQNRYGEKCSFDDLTSTLLTCPLDQTSCGGTHQLHALVVIARIDDEVPVLSPECRRSVDTFLRRAVSEIVLNQQSDGAWGTDWCGSSSLSGPAAAARPATDADGRLLITSHLCESLLILSAGFEVPAQVVRRALDWSSRRLLEIPPPEQSRRACPLAHVVAALKAAQRRERRPILRGAEHDAEIDYTAGQQYWPRATASFLVLCSERTTK